MTTRRTFLRGLAAAPVAAAIPFTPAVAAPIVPGLLGTLKADIERIVYTHAMFEFNDDLTRHFVRCAVTPYVSAAHQRGEIGNWRIICDKTNNTPVVVDDNDFQLDLIYQPKGVWGVHRMTFRLKDFMNRLHQENLAIEGDEI